MLHVAASTTTEHLPVNDEYRYFLDKFPTVFSRENGVLKDYQLELGIDSNGRWCRIRILHPYITVPGWKLSLSNWKTKITYSLSLAQHSGLCLLLSSLVSKWRHTHLCKYDQAE